MKTKNKTVRDIKTTLQIFDQNRAYQPNKSFDKQHGKKRNQANNSINAASLDVRKWNTGDGVGEKKIQITVKQRKSYLTPGIR